jgi:hypothetical protein
MDPAGTGAATLGVMAMAGVAAMDGTAGVAAMVGAAGAAPGTAALGMAQAGTAGEAMGMVGEAMGTAALDATGNSIEFPHVGLSARRPAALYGRAPRTR